MFEITSQRKKSWQFFFKNVYLNIIYQRDVTHRSVCDVAIGM